jgi:vitamin B12 transporter
MTFRSIFAHVALSSSVLILSATVSAADTSKSNTTSSIQVSLLDPVVVTPNLSSRTVEATLSSVTVIDEKQLREQQPTALTDIMRGQAGVDLTGNGSFGKNTSVFLRGNGSSSTLLLVDGVRLRSATNGGAAWQFLPPQLVDRVEIVRGPRGSLYGSDAVGGVVQVFTPDGSSPGGWMELGGGTFSSSRVAAGAEGEQDGTRYSIAVDRFNTAGTEVRENSEDRGYDNTSAIARLTHRFNNDAELGVFGFRAEGRSEYEGSLPETNLHTDYGLQVAGVKGQLWLTENWLTKLLISDARDDSKNFRNGNEDGEFNTRSQTANIQNIFLFGKHELVVGGEFIQDTIDTTLTYVEEERENGAGFAQLLMNFGRADVQASARYDDNEAYGEETTGAVALGYKVGQHHRLRGSYGTAFRAPTFNDLYYPGFGNPNLEAETSETTELGVRGQYQKWFWDLALYETDVDNLIAFAFQGGIGAPYNVNQARIRGAELTAGVELDQWRLRAALTEQDPIDKETGNILQRRAQQIMRVDVDRDLRAFSGAFSVGASAVLQGHRYDDAANTERLSGFGLVDVRASWQMAKYWSTRVTVNNVLDKEYTTTQNFAGWNYQNAGRSVFVSLRYDIR